MSKSAKNVKMAQTWPLFDNNSIGNCQLQVNDNWIFITQVGLKWTFTTLQQSWMTYIQNTIHKMADTKFQIEF